MTGEIEAALADLRAAALGIDQMQVDAALDAIAGARRIVLYGCGREGLQVRGLA
ncbi:MAG: 6-phospho-3-hexuloisomerase, partial [Silicimonas sp.]|nr:6-phospho-3-hexuloisomerase [Silicimonas sp.]